MKSRKVVVSVTAVFVTAILLAVIFTQACGSGTVNESEKMPEVELQFAMCYERWSSEDMIGEFLYKKIDHFNELSEDNIWIRAVTYSDHQYADKLNVLAASNQLPDLFWTIPGVPINQMARDGLLANLTSYLEEDTAWKASFRPGAFAASEVDGRIWSIPVLMNFCCLFYNTELFERAGISAEMMTTWEDFLSACESLRQNNITPLAIAAEDGSGLMPMAHSLVQRLGGAQQMSSMLEQGAQFDFTQEDFLVAGAMFNELVDQGYVNDNFRRTAEGMEKARFVQGKAAMLVADTTFLGSIYRDDSVVRGKVGMLPFPQVEGGEGQEELWVHTNSLVMSAACEHPDVVLDFFRWMTSANAQQEAADWIGQIPAAQPEEDIGKYLSELHIAAELLEQTSRFFSCDGILPDEDTVDFYMYAWEQVALGKAPEQSFAELQEQLAAREQMGREA
ncbi:MAG: ABC transporter substrate-binding protein [Oscillospiraceae bacterium]|jgi:raffinose/stachyose/melibiose transport system substrate-binding protein